MRTGLLVSVRSVEEAEAALQGGADLIDVKEPASGSLGKADDEVIVTIAAKVGHRVPVSAALGEWNEGHAPPQAPALQFVKWGPAGAARDFAAWQGFLSSHLKRLAPLTVYVAYADWQCAQAPPLDCVVDLACSHPGGVLLVDTHCKDPGSLERKPTLLDWLSESSLREVVNVCRAARIRVALAGSLGAPEIEALRGMRPDWFAVRSAVCDGSDRQATICAERVRAIKQVTCGQ